MLLAVEAIHLENLLTLRDEVLPKIRVSFESPLVAPAPPAVPSQAERELNRRRGFGGRTKCFIAFHYIAGFALVLAVDAFRIRLGIGPSNIAWVALWRWGSGWWQLLVLYALVALTLALYTVGCWVHRSVERLLSLLVALLVAIERGTPSGATGITGAIALAIGFTLQLVGLWA